MDTRRTPFDIEHGKLLEKASQNLEQLVSNLNQLNRNLETINTIGTDFNKTSALWSDFHKAIIMPKGESDSVDEERP